jgi:hypothetical protein
MIDTVHPKVRAATVASLAVSIVGATLVWIQDNPGLLGDLPRFWQGLVFLVVPPLLTFLAGYQQPAYDSPPPPVA